MTNDIPEVALSVSGLQKSYGNFSVIENLDLEIERGSVHGLVGLNGSGKTTTLECILGLRNYNGGSITVLGHSPEKIHNAHGRVVAIFDTPSLHPNLTLRQCLEHARILCQDSTRSPQQVEKLLGIEKFSHFKIKNLSLGNKRRASIAQALLGSPELILLDEPFSGLDAGGVDEVLALITKLNEELGTTFLLSSHQLPYLEQICSHIAILHEGKIALNNEISELLKASAETVLLATQDQPRTQEVVAQLDGCELNQQTSTGYLQVTLTGTNSARLNKALVNADIAVDEMILEKASLDSLFRKTISGETP